MRLYSGVAAAVCLFNSWTVAQPTEPAQAEAERLLQSGDYPQALARALEAARRLEAAHNRKGAGVAFNTAGAAALHQGDFTVALRYFNEALAIARQTGDGGNEVLRLNNLGALQMSFGRYADSFESYQAALRTLQRHQDEAWHGPRRRLTQANLAVLHQFLGQHGRALEIYRELRAAPAAASPAPSVEAQMLTNLAVVYRRLGDPQKALETHRAARALLRKEPNAAASLYVLHNIGVVQALDFQDYRGALATFEEALSAARKSGSRREEVTERLYLGECYLLLRDWARASKELEAALGGAEQLRLSDERWTALYGLGRVRLAEGRRREALRLFEGAIEEIESARSRLGAASLKAEFLAGKRDVYDAAIAQLLASDPVDVARVFRLIEQGRARTLRESLPGENAAARGLGEIQRGLDAHTALVEIWAGSEETGAIWVTRSDAKASRGGAARSLRPVLADLARSLANPRSQTWREQAERASRLMPATPPGGLPNGIRHLLVVPETGLAPVPLELLDLAGGGGTRRAIDRFAVSYLPSAQLARPAATTGPNDRRRWPWEVTLAAFADPQVPKADGMGLFDANWEPLPDAASEARTVARRLPGSESLHTGPENRREFVLDPALGQIPVLHFATHAAIDAADARRSRLLFSPARGDPASQYLFWGDIAKLKLPGVELVTLAACETEQGRHVRGEGVENFSRAFLAAGARATVTSLWRVSDRATTLFMERFYTALAAGATKAEALRQAKLARAGVEPHPFFWAAFVLTGDGASPLPPMVSWADLAVPGLALAGAPAVWWGWRRQRRTPR